VKYPLSIQNLIEELSKLPTVGPKTAERYVFYLLKRPEEELQRIARAVAGLKSNLTVCGECFDISEQSPCPVCADPKRARDVICVVADSRNLIAVEKTRQYNGLYYVIGGEINTIEGIGPENLNTGRLIERIKNNNIKEIILALNPTLEGETTSMYLTRLIKTINPNIKITRLAKGLPMGADLEYADEITISNALKYRTNIT